MNKLVVVIPFYKPNLTEFEIRSFNQCVSILKNYDIVIVAPKELPIDESFLKKVDVQYFANDFFKNIAAYNKLMLSRNFYNRFKTYEYILIYQLDAWIFEDNLEYWMKQKYDYIGAPWMNINIDNEIGIIKSAVGNGGFSLRKVSSALKVLQSFKMIYSLKFLLKRSIRPKKNTLIAFLKAIYYFLFSNNTFHVFNNYDRNEDIFWGYIVNKKFPWYKVPNSSIAKYFSIDESINNYVSNNKKPMACHGKKALEYFNVYNN